MALELFFTYDSATYALKGVPKLSQADADAAAAADAGLSALQGGLTQVRDAAGNDVDATQAEPDGIWSVFDDAPRVRQAERDLTPIKTGGWAFWRRLDFLSDERIRVGRDYPRDDNELADDLIWGIRQGVYLVLRSAAITTQQKGLFLQNSALGPTDPGYSRDDPESFYRIAHTVVNRDVTGPISIVRLTDFTRLTIADIVGNLVTGHGDAPGPDELDGGSFLDDLTI